MDENTITTPFQFYPLDWVGRNPINVELPEDLARRFYTAQQTYRDARCSLDAARDEVDAFIRRQLAPGGDA